MGFHISPSTEEHQAPKPVKVAAEDAIEAGVGSNYPPKHWDTTEKSILLLGSVLDVKSLGKYIYAWTVYGYGELTATADAGNDVWLAFVKAAGRLKKAEEKFQKSSQSGPPR